MFPLLAVLGLSGGELMVVLVAVLVLFGSKKIPEFAKGLGQGIKEFKKASREVTDEINNAGNETPSHPLSQVSRQAPVTQPSSATPPSTVPKA